VIGNHIKLHPLAAARWRDVRGAAVRREIEALTRSCDHPEFAAFRVRSGIDSISVNPDSFVPGKRAVAAAEAAFGKSAERGQRSGRPQIVRAASS
jgi:hypothetical protein